MLKLIESLLHNGARFYDPIELGKKLAVEHGLDIVDICDTPSLGYFLTAAKME